MDNVFVYHKPETGKQPKFMPATNVEAYSELFEKEIMDIVEAKKEGNDWKPVRAPKSITPIPVKPPITERDVVLYLHKKGKQDSDISKFLGIKLADVEKYLSL